MEGIQKLNKLQQFRKEKGLTQQELSTLSGIQLNTIKALEQGISQLSNAKASTIMALAKALKMSMEELIAEDK